MWIGLDFDNTIVNYDHVFHAVAVESGLVPADIPATKFAVRDFLRRADREELWTELQGLVYGTRMGEAEPYPGVLAFLHRARAAQVKVSIISHKTRYPYRGPQYDLHDAARSWIDAVLRDESGALVPEQRVHFELTKDAKLERIAAVGCTSFVDDLPEILLSPAFPAATDRILFAPDGATADPQLLVMRNWQEITTHYEALWTVRHLQTI